MSCVNADEDFPTEASQTYPTVICLSVDDWMKEIRDINRIEYYSSISQNEIPSFAARRMCNLRS